MNKSIDEYNWESIQVLEGLEAVRKRPGMYIGTTSVRGLHHLVWEIIDNAIDESLAGYCNLIEINILKDNIIEVIDNGRGIPIDIHPKTKVSTIETVFTVLHAGGKFDSNTYKISGGLHGVGASVVNALSEKLTIEVAKNGKLYRQEFVDGGKVLTKLTEIGSTDKTGTKIIFKPDPLIFTETVEFNFSTIANRIKQLAFLNKLIEISLNDLRDEEERNIRYKFSNGIKDYVTELNHNLTAINNVLYIDKKQDQIEVEFSFQYSETYTDNIFSFCNNINTHEGGTHEEGMRLALTREFNNYFKNVTKDKSDNRFIWEDIKEGLTAIVSVRHPDPQYEGQTKNKLANSDARKVVNELVGDALKKYLLENPDDAKKIIEKISLSVKARIAAKKAKEMTRRKNVIDSFSLPGKLADCESKLASESEIFIVEGDSAGGSAKMGRERRFQAILPLKGKVLNVEKARQIKVYENTEIVSMITALGVGVKADFNIKKLRYHKVIIMTDADVDGAHIRVLLLTFFYRYMKGLIENGNVYIAQPPLYKIQSGKKIKYVYSDKELEDEKKIFNNYTIQRYKGLGEMDANQLWETTMDPDNRILLKVNVEDAIEANDVFSDLMGDNVEPRKQFIKDNAKYVKNLDI